VCPSRGQLYRAEQAGPRRGMAATVTSPPPRGGGR
jgi:hypothetical protein